MSDFVFTRTGLKGAELRLERILEIVPGLISWLFLAGTVAISFIHPIAGALWMIAFLYYWILRISYSMIFLITAYIRLSIEKKTDWMSFARSLDGMNAHSALGEVQTGTHWRERLRSWFHTLEYKKLQKSRAYPPLLKDIVHLVIIPISKEPQSVLEPGIQSIRDGRFPPEQIMIICAVEEWASDEVKAGVEAVAKKYRADFLDFIIQKHPNDIPGEARVKGANITHAAKRAVREFKTLNIPLENIIVSCFDADTVVSPEYFACLTYTFMITPKRNRASFQPIPVYHNNIWEVPDFAKVIETGSSFFMLVESTNPGKLVTFSSHSMSFKALVDVGFWPVDMISDDSAIFWKCFIHFNGDYRAVPMCVTLSMDIADAGVWWKTAVNVYKQKRRWAWGVEGFPIVVRGFIKKKGIPLWTRISYGFRMLESYITWATWSFLLAISWLPATLVKREFETSVVYYGSSRISSVIFSMSYLILFGIIILSIAMLPKKKIKFSIARRIGFALQWFLLPITYIFFNALPALDAQTRLMFGKYMEFWVTDKRRDSG